MQLPAAWLAALRPEGCVVLRGAGARSELHFIMNNDDLLKKSHQLGRMEEEGRNDDR
jgi:hypothetical protein